MAPRRASPIPIWRASWRAAHERTGPPALPAHLDLRTGVTVDAARRAADGWQLRSVEHGWLAGRFEALVLAVPAPQVVPLLSRFAYRSRMLAARVRMRQPGADAALRGTACAAFDAAFVNYGPLRWIARDSSKPGRGGTETWLLHANAAWSEVHIDEDAQTVAELLLAAFVELGGARPAAWSAPLALCRYRGGPRSGLCLAARGAHRTVW